MHDECQLRHGSLSHGGPLFMDGSEPRTSGGKEIQWSVSPQADRLCCPKTPQYTTASLGVVPVCKITFPGPSVVSAEWVPPRTRLPYGIVRAHLAFRWSDAVEVYWCRKAVMGGFPPEGMIEISHIRE